MVTTIPPPIERELRILLSLAGNERTEAGVVVKARITAVFSQWAVDYALVGLGVSFVLQATWPRAAKRKFPLHKGWLYQGWLSRENAVPPLLDGIASGRLIPYDEEITPIKLLWMAPMTEPCVRVPLSILERVAGMTSEAERSRQAIVKACGDDL